MKQKQTPEEKRGFLENENEYLKKRIARLKKYGASDPELTDWYITVAKLNLEKNLEELESLGSK
tara:strand:- start:4019 stop:4210 length:192 start_codon:yes stop_codon:yes gene_type:complete